MTTMNRTLRLLPAIFLISPAFSQAQVPVDDAGRVIGQASSGAEIMPLGEDDIPRLGDIELQELVGPVALYPDDLLAVVLPASAYPLQVAAAARFLEAREDDPTLEPDPEWDDSIVALLNYPEVVELMNRDLDWTYRLGEAVVAQQADVVAAVEAFRDRAYAAGNLKSDEYQTIERSEEVIRITPVSEEAIYVPYYEPERVVVYQPRPVYYYYPRPCPVYYYPYSSAYRFDRGFFWGVTTAFTIGWMSDSVHVYHHSYRGHPYYGRYYRDNWWYRRPSINIHNTTYITNTNVHVTRNVDIDRGDRWQARSDRRDHVVREGYTRHSRSTNARATNLRTIDSRAADTRRVVTRNPQTTGTTRERQPQPIRFRDRSSDAEKWTPRDRTRVDGRSGTTQPRATTSPLERGYVPSRTETRVPATRKSDPRRQEPTRRVRPEATTTVRQAPTRTVRQEPARRETSRPARQEPARRETSRPARQEPTRRETSSPARQQRAAPQRESRSAAAKRESRASDRRSSERSSRQRR